MTSPREVMSAATGRVTSVRCQAPATLDYWPHALIGRASNAAAKAATNKSRPARTVPSWQTDSSPRAVTFTVGRGLSANEKGVAKFSRAYFKPEADV